jgi:hypothetical protein
VGASQGQQWDCWWFPYQRRGLPHNEPALACLWGWGKKKEGAPGWLSVVPKIVKAHHVTRPKPSLLLIACQVQLTRSVSPNHIQPALAVRLYTSFLSPMQTGAASPEEQINLHSPAGTCYIVEECVNHLPAVPLGLLTIRQVCATPACSLEKVLWSSRQNPHDLGQDHRTKSSLQNIKCLERLPILALSQPHILMPKESLS